MLLFISTTQRGAACCERYKMNEQQEYSNDEEEVFNMEENEKLIKNILKDIELF